MSAPALMPPVCLSRSGYKTAASFPALFLIQHFPAYSFLRNIFYVLRQIKEKYIKLFAGQLNSPSICYNHLKQRKGQVSQPMIQDIFPHRFDNHFKPGIFPQDDDTVFCFSKDGVLCLLKENSVCFPKVSDCTFSDIPIYLSELDGSPLFLSLSIPDKIPEGFSYMPLRRLRKKDTPDKALIFAAITAGHLYSWYSSCRFCGSCGAPLVPSGTERAMVCLSCKKVFYPRINPAVIVGVTDHDNLLLTKYAGRNMPFYALVAGFTEIGETFEETAAREVMEETGLEVENIRYYKSQPWGFADDILAGFFCDVKGSAAIRMDTGELKEAVWMPRREIPGQPDDFSLTNEMMMAFKRGLI